MQRYKNISNKVSGKEQSAIAFLRFNDAQHTTSELLMTQQEFCRTIIQQLIILYQDYAKQTQSFSFVYNEVFSIRKNNDVKVFDLFL